MNKKITGKSVKFNISGRNAEEGNKKIEAEDFGKRLPTRRKKPKTYFEEFNDILKYFIDIDVNIKNRLIQFWMVRPLNKCPQIWGDLTSRNITSAFI